MVGGSNVTVASRPFAELLETMCNCKDLVQRSFCYMTFLSMCAHLCESTYTLDAIRFPQKVNVTQEDALLLRDPRQCGRGE